MKFDPAIRPVPTRKQKARADARLKKITRLVAIAVALAGTYFFFIKILYF